MSTRTKQRAALGAVALALAFAACAKAQPERPERPPAAAIAQTTSTAGASVTTSTATIVPTVVPPSPEHRPQDRVDEAPAAAPSASHQQPPAPSAGTMVHGPPTPHSNPSDPTPQPECDICNDHGVWNATSAIATAFTALFTLFLLFVGIWVGCNQIELMKRQTTIMDDNLRATADAARAAVAGAEVAMKSMVLTHRPQLTVRNLVVRQPRPTFEPPPRPFAPNSYISGQFYVANRGGTNAHITDSGCWVFWKQGTWRRRAGEMPPPLPSGIPAGEWVNDLPGERPYEGKNGNIGGLGKLPPGMSMPVPFLSETPMGDEGDLIREGREGWSLWIMGWIEYSDESDPPLRRRTAFCREWGPGADAFVPVDDPDYEHEE